MSYSRNVGSGERRHRYMFTLVESAFSAACVLGYVYVL